MFGTLIVLYTSSLPLIYMFSFGFLFILFYCTLSKRLTVWQFQSLLLLFWISFGCVCVCWCECVIFLFFVYSRCFLYCVFVVAARQLKSKLDEHLHIKEISQLRLGSCKGLLRPPPLHIHLYQSNGILLLFCFCFCRSQCDVVTWTQLRLLSVNGRELRRQQQVTRKESVWVS